MKLSEHNNVSIVVWAALAANILIAISKFVVAAITGSSAMLSEAIHSTADTGNELLLVLGVKLSRKPADARHPFGHGHEIYFWGLIVAIVLFGIGGGLSFYEGIHRIANPRALGDPFWSYVVLGIAALFESASFAVATRKMRDIAKRQGATFWAAARASKNPEHFVVLFEDTAALLGIALAFGGVYASHRLDRPMLDGVASLAIGAVLTISALFLAFECKSLLIGESADRAKVRGICAIAAADPAVASAGEPLTMHLGPRDVLLNLDVQFRPNLTTDEIAASIRRLERAIQAKYADVRRIYIEVVSVAPATS